MIDEQQEKDGTRAGRWTRNGIVNAVDTLLKQPNTLFDDIIKQLAEYPELSRIANRIFEMHLYQYFLTEKLIKDRVSGLHKNDIRRKITCQSF